MMDLDRIYCGDCMDLFKQIPDNSIHLVVTSPPYNVDINYDIYKDLRPWDEYYDWCRKWLKEIYRVLAPDGRFCLDQYLSLGWVGHRHSPAMDLNWIATREIGFQHHGVAEWMDTTLTKRTAWGSWISPSAPYVNSPFEVITIFYKDHWKLDRTGEATITKEEFMEACSGVWKLPTEHRRAKKDKNGEYKNNGWCPAPFPVALPRRCINLLTYKGDIVLDPFMGSGTTAVAAIETGRHYIGSEISPAYCETAEERIILEHAKNYAKMAGYTIDSKVGETIARGLRANVKKHGAQYCPCKIRTGDPERDRKIICPCETHVNDIEETGHCKCRLFKRNGNERTRNRGKTEAKI